MHRKLNIPQEVYDIIIVGGGPAGLTAGIYASRARMKTLLIESFSVIGQATMTEKIENYPGIESVGGFELVNIFKKQAQNFGLECTTGTVRSIDQEKENDCLLCKTETEDKTYKALSVIVASGARPKKLNVPGEKEFLGKGISYCAICDAAFFKDKEIVVVGGGDTAVEEALYLTRFASKVTLIHRRDRLRAARIPQEQISANEKVEFVWKSVVGSIEGDEKVNRVIIRDVDTAEKKEITCEGVFIFTGWHPSTDFVDGVVELGEKGNIIVDEAMKTSKNGIFACGDCTKKVLHQVVTACGDGATAAYSAQQYVEELKGIAYK